MKLLYLPIILALWGGIAEAGQIDVEVPPNKGVTIKVARYRAQVTSVQFLTNLGDVFKADPKGMQPVQQDKEILQNMQLFQPEDPTRFKARPQGFQIRIKALWSGGGDVVNPMCKADKTEFADNHVVVNFYTGCNESANTVVRLEFEGKDNNPKN